MTNTNGLNGDDIGLHCNILTKANLMQLRAMLEQLKGEIGKREANHNYF